MNCLLNPIQNSDEYQINKIESTIEDVISKKMQTFDSNEINRRQIDSVTVWNNPITWDYPWDVKTEDLAREGCVSKMRLHLTQLDSALLQSLQHNEKSLLHIPAADGNLSMVIMLLGEFKLPLTPNWPGRGTILHTASRCGRESVVQYLLTYDDKICCINVSDSITANNPIHCACAKGSLPVVKLLVNNGAVLGVSNRRQETPFLVACKNNNLEVVKYLLREYRSVIQIDKPDLSYSTSLYHSINIGSFELVMLLITEGACLDSPGSYWTAVQLASRCSDHSAALKMVTHLTDTCNLPLVSGMFNNCPLEFATRMGNVPLREFIENRMKNPNKNDCQSGQELTTPFTIEYA